MTDIRTRISHEAIEEISRRYNATLWYGFDPDIETVRRAAAAQRAAERSEMADELEALIDRAQEERTQDVHDRLSNGGRS